MHTSKHCHRMFLPIAPLVNSSSSVNLCWTTFPSLRRKANPELVKTSLPLNNECKLFLALVNSILWRKENSWCMETELTHFKTISPKIRPLGNIHLPDFSEWGWILLWERLNICSCLQWREGHWSATFPFRVYIVLQIVVQGLEVGFNTWSEKAPR